MEDVIRLTAFKWLEDQVRIHGDVLPRKLLEQGFGFRGQKITLVGPQGIWKPKIFEQIPISITTVAGGPYDDVFSNEGFLLYRYRGTDPKHRDNVGLREAMHKQTPLIYFHGIVRGKYLAVWPVFIIGDDSASIHEHINKSSEHKSKIAEADMYFKRKYITSTIRQRLHQKSFRERVLEAYREQCAFCRLKHSELLDAAHIIPDSDKLGEPTVSNGLSLCKIHHAAFDSNFIGVSPDFKIIVREDIRWEKDGPMLKYGIQQLHDKRIILPRNRELWPDQARLETRFKKFIGA